MKTWEKIAWPMWVTMFGFVLGWALYVFTH